MGFVLLAPQALDLSGYAPLGDNSMSVLPFKT